MRAVKEQYLKYDFPSEVNNKEIILPQIFKGITELHAGMSTLRGGNLSFKVGDNPSIVKRNRKNFFSQYDISEQQLAIPIQCHSNAVLRINKPGEYNDCDALITNVKYVALIVTVADCVPILLFDPINKVIGILHAGWRGTVGKICRQTVMKMKEEFLTDPSNVLAFIGPSAGSCCYEVGTEVAVMFGNKVVPYNGGKIIIDLKNENKLQLLDEGVLLDHIEVSGFCTICEKRLFHSYRRDGIKAGRMIAVICIIR